MLGIKFQKIKNYLLKIKELEKNEQYKLFLEFAITVVAMLFIYLGGLFILNHIFYDGNFSFELKKSLGLTDRIILLIKYVFTIFMLILTIWLTRWRIGRRYRRFELQHVLQELDFIAKGNYHHRISHELVDRLGSVVVSINKLVDSTVNAMNEERKIEQTKQELITNVSHDIRTPLTSIIGYLSLVEESNFETIDEVKSYIHIAYLKAQQLKQLTDKLFEYVSVQNIQEQLVLKQIAIKNFLTQIAAEYEYEANKKNIVIEIDVQNDFYIAIDVDKFVRIYDNLLSNAFKYSQATTITLKAYQSEFDNILIVENNGKMIEKNVAKNVFNRFYRESESRNSEIVGSGLGLAIVESIVKLHQGNIYIDSIDNSTKFIIKLPKDSHE